MTYLKFRIKFEDYDDIYRDIEVRADNSFTELLTAWLKSIGFDQKHKATFYRADHLWRKGEKVIEVVDNGAKDKTEIIDYIDDPHQHFILEYDEEARWLFTIELIKVNRDSYAKIFPNIIAESGIPPVQYKETLIIPTRERPPREAPKKQDDIEKLFLAALAGDELSDDESNEDESHEKSAAVSADEQTEPDELDIAEIEAEDISIDPDILEMQGSAILETGRGRQGLDDEEDMNGFGEEDADEYGSGEEDDYFGSGARSDYEDRNDYD